MSLVLDYIDRQSENASEILYELHDYFCSFDNISAKLRYRIPFYDQKTWVCYTNGKKQGGVELVFLRGRELPAFPTLEARGRTMVKGIYYETRKSIDYTILEAVWLEALDLDMRTPFTIKKKTKY